MAQDENKLRQQIVEIGRLMYDKGWVASNDGNISVRLDAERILCTPTGVSKGRMAPDDLIICDLEGRKIAGRRERTSEILMHLTFYQMRPDVQAVTHAHAPIATGFAVAGRALNLAILPEVVVNLGCVPLAAYGLPGTPELSDSLKPYIPTYDAILLGNHGVVCSGADLWSAFHKMETVEHVARIALVAEQLGGPKLLDRHEVQRLFEARGRYGIQSNSSALPGCPIAAEDYATAGAGSDTITLTRAELIALVEEAVQARRS